MAKYDKTKFIWIGGALYSRTISYHGWRAKILGYDINTERHILIETAFGAKKKVELDDDRIIMRERYERKAIPL